MEVNSMGITREEVINTAIKLENDGIKFYKDIASKTHNELTRKMFESLADDELKHIEWISNQAPDVKTSGEFNQKLYSRLKKIFAEPSEKIKDAARATDDDIKAIDIAINMEIQTQDEYLRFSDETEDPDIEELFTILADIERFHADILQNSKEYLDSPHDWFMQEEGWMFDGG
jgi:rubrerythrin